MSRDAALGYNEGSTYATTIAGGAPVCRGLLGRIFGHNFQPRYHVFPSLTSDQLKVWPPAVPVPSHSVYLYDVCTRCGTSAKIKRHERHGHVRRPHGLH